VQFTVGDLLFTIGDLLENFVLVRQLVDSFPKDLSVFFDFRDRFANQLSNQLYIFATVFFAASDKVAEIVLVPITETRLQQFFLQLLLLLGQRLGLAFLGKVELFLFLKQLL
jgi:hypothetical protein